MSRFFMKTVAIAVAASHSQGVDAAANVAGDSEGFQQRVKGGFSAAAAGAAEVGNAVKKATQTSAEGHRQNVKSAAAAAASAWWKPCAAGVAGWFWGNKKEAEIKQYAMQNIGKFALENQIFGAFVGGSAATYMQQKPKLQQAAAKLRATVNKPRYGYTLTVKSAAKHASGLSEEARECVDSISDKGCMAGACAKKDFISSASAFCFVSGFLFAGFDGLSFTCKKCISKKA